jgi:Mycotoxin biosynthesis protein UstYa
MCKPDLSLVTFRWINNTAQHEDPTSFYPTNFDASLHECADWELLDSWAGARMFDLYHIELLQKPEHG